MNEQLKSALKRHVYGDVFSAFLKAVEGGHAIGDPPEHLKELFKAADLYLLSLEEGLEDKESHK